MKSRCLFGKTQFFFKQPSLVGIPTWSRAHELWLTRWVEIEWWTAEEDISGAFQSSDCAIGERFFNDLLRKFQCSEEFAQWLSNQTSAANFKSEEADCESFFCDSVRQVVVFLSLRFMPVCHARFHWTSKVADNDVFGGFGWWMMRTIRVWALNQNFVVSVGIRADSCRGRPSVDILSF